MTKGRPLRIFVIAGEHSGDRLAASLIQALEDLSPKPVTWQGVGGDAMADAGCKSLFPLSEISVMGPIAILQRLPAIIRRVHETVAAVVTMQPDALIIIDSPEFTHAVAKRVRRKLPGLPVIDYVSPSIWAWRKGRAKKMRAYVDHVLAILPFEPALHQELGGPACTYVGHPLIEKYKWIRNRSTEELRKRLKIKKTDRVIAVLPGSRVNEIKRMMPAYGQTIKRVINQIGPVEVIMPLASGRKDIVVNELADWPVTPHFVEGDDDKFTAFRLADAALATSGTVTMEIALSGTPMVVGYKTEAIVAMFRWVMQSHSFVLANLVLGKNAFPEFLQEHANPENLSTALLPLLDPKSTELQKQLQALDRIGPSMMVDSGTPSRNAAQIVLDCIENNKP